MKPSDVQEVRTAGALLGMELQRLATEAEGYTPVLGFTEIGHLLAQRLDRAGLIKRE